MNSLYKSASGEREIRAFYDAVLARWPVPHEELNVATRYGNTFAIASGDASAPALILLHGASSNAVSWVGDVPEYSRYYRVYAVDIPGDPGKSAPERPSWNSPAYAEWMEDFMTGAKISKAVLLGLSQGGWIAIKYAAYQPERVEKLVLLTPAGVVADKSSFLIRAILFSLAGRRGAESINRMVLGDQSVHEDAIKYMNLILTQFKSRIERLIPFTDEELKRLTMPTLLIGGKQDAIRDVEKIAGRMKTLAPVLTVKVYPEKGHALINLAGDIIPFLTSNLNITPAKAGV